MLALAMLSLPALAQRSSDSQSSGSQNSGSQNSGAQSSDSQAPDAAPPPATSATPTKAPALVDPDGPDVSLQSSEALFDIAAALNSCGYDQGLAASDPLRMQIRAEVNQALVESAEARDAHDQVCTFIAQHRLSNPGLDLAQYISLALYTTPPPNLAPSAQDVDMPPIRPRWWRFFRCCAISAGWSICTSSGCAIVRGMKGNSTSCTTRCRA